MSLNESITHGKEHRKPYRVVKAIDYTCRNHGGCEWAEGIEHIRTIKGNCGRCRSWKNIGRT